MTMPRPGRNGFSVISVKVAMFHRFCHTTTHPFTFSRPLPNFGSTLINDAIDPDSLSQCTPQRDDEVSRQLCQVNEITN